MLPQPFEPKLLAMFVRSLRMTQEWSQEALAETAGVTNRTIQRLEAGEPSSRTTRRAVAHAFGYEDRDAFDNPEVIKSVKDMLERANEAIRKERDEKLEAEHPNSVRIAVSECTTGAALAALVEGSDAIMFDCDGEARREAREIAGTLFDAAQDHNMIYRDVEPSQRLELYDVLADLLTKLHSAGSKVFTASRKVTIRLPTGGSETYHAGYVCVFEGAKAVREIIVRKGISF